MAQCRQLHPDLMRTPSFQLNPDQGPPAFHVHHPVVEQGLLGAFSSWLNQLHQVLLAVLEQITAERALQLLQIAVDNG